MKLEDSPRAFRNGLRYNTENEEHREEVSMIHTYEEYQTMPQSLTLEQMVQLHRELTEEIGQDEDALELYDLLLQNAVQYAQIRASWVLMTSSQRADADKGRTLQHNTLIDSFDMMARFLRSMGKPAAWRDALGDNKTDRLARKTIGDFGCYLAFVGGLTAR